MPVSGSGWLSRAGSVPIRHRGRTGTQSPQRTLQWRSGPLPLTERRVPDQLHRRPRTAPRRRTGWACSTCWSLSCVRGVLLGGDGARAGRADRRSPGRGRAWPRPCSGRRADAAGTGPARPSRTSCQGGADRRGRGVRLGGQGQRDGGVAEGERGLGEADHARRPGRRRPRWAAPSGRRGRCPRWPRSSAGGR